MDEGEPINGGERVNGQEDGEVMGETVDQGGRWPEDEEDKEKEKTRIGTTAVLLSTKHQSTTWN